MIVEGSVVFTVQLNETLAPAQTVRFSEMTTLEKSKIYQRNWLRGNTIVYKRD